MLLVYYRVLSIVIYLFSFVNFLMVLGLEIRTLR
jgi:hypothetical protein